MSQVKQPVCYPPQFPLQGRLPQRVEQVQDNLHAVLNNTYVTLDVAAGREPWGSYFNERMVFFGEANRRDLALLPDGAKALDGIAQTLQVDARQRAQVQRDIAAVWESHYAKVSEVNDELA